MRVIRRLLAIVSSTMLGVIAVPLPVTPVAYANDLGTTDFNIAANLAGIAQQSVSVGSLNCSDGSRAFNSSSDMFIGLARDQRLQSQLSLSCQPTLIIDSGVKSTTGTMTIPSKGITDGVFESQCTARSNMAVNANIVIGAAVPGLISVSVSSASAPLAFGCTFKGSSASKATEVFGTIEGYGDVSGMCSSACVSLSMTARATITSATGELKGQTGTGTYTYSDAFELPELAAVADQLARMKGKSRERDQRVSCPEGAADCTVYESSPCPNGEETCKFETTGCPPGASCTSTPFECPAGATCTTTPPQNASDDILARLVTNSRPPSTMSINLRAGAGEVVIVRPMPPTDGGVAVLSRTQPITLSGPPLSKCTLTIVGRKTVRRPVTLSALGTVTAAYSTAQLATLTRQLGLPAKSKVKQIVSLSASCTTESGVVAAKSRRMQLG